MRGASVNPNFQYHTIPLPKTQPPSANYAEGGESGYHSAATLRVTGTRVVITVSPESSLTMVTTIPS